MAKVGPFKPRSRGRPSGIVRLNRDSPLAKGLIHYWPCTEGGGFPQDIAGNLKGTGTSTPPWGVGRAGRAIELVQSTPTPETTQDVGAWAGAPCTVACWVNHDATGDIGYFSKGSGSYDFVFWSNSSTYDAGAGSAFLMVSTGTAVHVANRGLDTLLVVRVKGDGTANTDWEIWVNGVDESSTRSGSTAPIVTAGEYWWLGGYASSQNMIGRWWNGGVWNRALADSEIRALWHPSTRNDLIWQPQIQIPAFVADTGVPFFIKRFRRSYARPQG